ncbi:MAG: hypothetical protein SFV81_21190 [Pirellulaceae bacterium]|nr:hypothetical protein [Pirellulaceae bacterium]
MSKFTYTIVLVALMLFSICSGGCATSGRGGGYGSSDGHAGHSH